MSAAGVKRHVIGDEAFAALAAGGGGPGAVGQLADVEHSRHLLLLRGVVAIARRAGHPRYETAREAYDLLAAIQQYSPAIVEQIVRYPSVGAWASRTVLALDGAGQRPDTGPSGLAAVAAAAAIRARFHCQIEVPLLAGRVTLPSLGQVTGLADSTRTVVLRSAADGAEVIAGRRGVPIPADPHTDGPGWRGLRRLAARSGADAIRLLIDDLDPFRMTLQSPGPRLDAAEAARWQAILDEAWELLVAHHHDTALEISAAIRVLTPLAARSRGQASATSRETFGCVQLSQPRDPLSLALTLAHEVQHAKLCALLDIMRLTNPDGRRYYAPWRDDPRPVSGLLQGAYAYLGVAGFWRRQRHVESGNRVIRAHAEFARWRSAVRDATQVLLDNGSLTSQGEVFVSGMANVVHGWQDEAVPADALALARDDAAAHAARWPVRDQAAGS